MATINAHLDLRQASLMRRLLATGRPVIGIAVCNPYDLAAFPDLKTYLATYEYTQPALSMAAGALFGAFAPQGRLPVNLPLVHSSVEANQG
jgi:beta-N-acetylhexosaminidase